MRSSLGKKILFEIHCNECMIAIQLNCLRRESILSYKAFLNYMKETTITKYLVNMV